MKETKKEITGTRKKVADIMAYIYGGGILFALFIGALSFIGYLVAIIIGGEVATKICTVIYKSIYPILFTFTSCTVLFGLVKMYVAGEKSLSNKKKVKKTPKKEKEEQKRSIDLPIEENREGSGIQNDILDNKLDETETEE